ncbi:uncharacterized protein LJ206_014786 isoform 1-T1 [Theristicus caerulescens]
MVQACFCPPDQKPTRSRDSLLVRICCIECGERKRSVFFTGEEDVENIPYMENCESYHGICIKGSFCGRSRVQKILWALQGTYPSTLPGEEEEKTTLVWKSRAE